MRTGHVPGEKVELVRIAVPTGPRTLVPKMCGGIQTSAEIVRNLSGGAPTQLAQNIGVPCKP